MAVPRAIQALRLLVVALAVSAAMPPASAQMITNMGGTTMAATAAFATLPPGGLAITQPASSFDSSCGVSSTIQSADTATSIIASYSATLTQLSDLEALNPGMDFTQPLPVGMSICVGGPSSCNMALVNGVCPSTLAPLTDCSTSSVQLTTPLMEDLVLMPDFCTILQDPNTLATLFNIGGVTSLVMRVKPSNKAARAVAANPGHPQLGLWLASGSKEAMVIAIRPAWFGDGSPMVMFAPGNILGWLVQFPVASGSSSSWFSQLSGSLQSLLKTFVSKRKLSRKLLQGGGEAPGGGVRGTSCGSWCYGR